ncbi:MAG: hypothetical protein ABW133_25085 [Polyangiaceae bacterium]
MRYETRAVLSTLAAIAALTTGCKQQSREEAEPAPAATPSAAAQPTPAPPPAATVPDPAAPASIDIPPPVQPPTTPAAAPAPSGSAAAAKKPAAESLKTCCAALRKEATTAPDKAQLYNSAAGSCDAIDKLVAAGTTKKSAALTTLRAGLKGQKLPAGCE